MPLLFYINPLNFKKYAPNLLKIFSMGCAATILYLYINAIITMRFYHLPLSQIFSPAFTNHNFSQPINLHATFFSLQVAVALVFMLSLLVKEKKTVNRVFNSIICLVLLVGIIQLCSKSVFIALFLIINIAFAMFLLRGAARKRFIIISCSLTAAVIAIIFSWGTFRERYLDELRLDFAATNKGLNVEPRLMRWDAAVKVIGESPVIGHGAGSEIPLLQQKYFERKYYTSYLHRLNAHNEYLSFLIKSGILGLFAYLVTLFYGFRTAIRKKDVVFLGLMTLIAIVSLSENILDVDKGVMFYSFFFTFFVFISEQKDELPAPVKKHKNLRKLATKRIAIPSL
jgi:O-antigen ligase